MSEWIIVMTVLFLLVLMAAGMAILVRPSKQTDAIGRMEVWQ